jgi:hypothetical protein
METSAFPSFPASEYILRIRTPPDRIVVAWPVDGTRLRRALSLISSSLNPIHMSSSQSNPKRPLGVTIIAIVAAAGGILSLFGGGSVLAGMASGPFALAIIVIIFGILGLALGAGFFTGAKWAWMAGVIIYVISIGLGIAEIIYGGQVGLIGGIIRTVAGIVIPVYLTRPGPKSFFGRVRSSPRA